MKLLPLLLVAGTTLAAEPPAGPTTERDWQIHFELTAIQLPEKIILPLLDDLNAETRASAAFKSLEKNIAHGEATLTGKLIGVSRHGEQTKASSTEEIRYGTTFLPPAYPALGSAKDVSSLPKDQQTVSFGPIGFEVRPVGFTLEADPEISSDGQRIHISINVRHSRLLGWTEFASGITPQGAKLSIKQPRFFEAWNASTLDLRSGQRTLVGIHKLPDMQPTWELFFVKVWSVRKPGATEPEK